MESHMYLMFLECSCTTDESGVSWAVKIDLMEKGYKQGIESGDVDEGNEVL